MPNVIGEPLNDYVIKQILDRQELHGRGTVDTAQTINFNERTPELIATLNTNTSWVKLASGISISSSRLDDIDVPASLHKTGLAKKYVLYSGWSQYNDGKLNQRDGFTPGISDTVNSSYTHGNYGYSPMPGIISADIKALNRGSIKKATVKLKAHNKKQFDIIDYLYLRLGYTVLLEWGNSIYIDKENDKLVAKRMGNTLIEDVFFNSNEPSHLKFSSYVETYREKYKGNYDGLLCKVSNFSWTFNDDGSYDIDLTLISLGDVVESLKANVPVDAGTLDYVKNNSIKLFSTTNDNPIDQNASKSVINAILWLFKRQADNKELYEDISIIDGKNVKHLLGKFISKGGTTLTQTTAKYAFYNWKRVTRVGVSGDLFEPVLLGEKEFTSTDPQTQADNHLVSLYRNSPSVKYVPNEKKQGKISNVKGNLNIPPNTRILNENLVYQHYYSEIVSPSTITTTNPLNSAPYHAAFTLENSKDPQYYLRFDYLLQTLSEYCIPLTLPSKNPLFKLDINRWGSKMLFQENQISLDPRVCLVQNKNFKKYDPNGGAGGTAVVFEEISNWIEDTEKKYAYPLNIYLNFNFIIDSLSSAMDERGDINIFSFLSNICSGLNKALGGINNLEPVINEDTNTMYIIDSSLNSQGGKSDVTYKLKILGYTKQGNFYESNFIRKIDLRTAITPEYAAMVTIGATAGGYVKGTEGTAFSNWNLGLTDRFKEKITPPNESSQDKNTTGSLDEALNNYYKEFSSKIDECYGFKGGFSNFELSDSLIGKNISLGTEYLKYNLSKNKKSSVGFIPFKLGLKMDGLSGMKIYNKLEIDTSYLPSNYGDTLSFIVTGVNHSLSGNDWETEILTMAVPGTQNDEDIIFTQDTGPVQQQTNQNTTLDSDDWRSYPDVQKITFGELKNKLIASDLKQILGEQGICALIGHMSCESGGRGYRKIDQFNPNAFNLTQSLTVNSVGLCQWQGSRKGKLLDYAKQNNLNPKDVDTQIGFIVTDFKNSFNPISKLIKDNTKTTLIQKLVIIHLTYGTASSTTPTKIPGGDLYKGKQYDPYKLNDSDNTKNINKWGEIYTHIYTDIFDLQDPKNGKTLLPLRWRAAENCFKNWVNN